MSHKIAIVGATGLVGATLISLINEKSFPFTNIYFVASQQSAGKTIDFDGKKHPIYNLADFDFQQTSLAFFCISGHLASEYIPKATAAGNIVIDKSNHYRINDKVPLIVPEVNLEDLQQYKQLNIIANPNCNVIPLAVALKPLYDAVGIKRLNVCTYQAVSGTGKDAVTELTEQTQQLLNHQSVQSKIYPQQIAFNVLPGCDEFQENGYTLEEMKIILELQKILKDKHLAVNPTAVRVPVFYAHSAAVHIETQDKLTVKQALQLLSQAPSVKLMNGKAIYPTPAIDAAGTDFVYVGRIREDISHPYGLNLWIVTDNLRKGAALNALQIAKEIK
jgi:aspartate-semialdehyde dehydrogenase